MPKRSNSFQRLVFLIEKATQNSDFRVSESKEYLEDSSGAPREVDVVIEGSIGNHAVRIAVEAIDSMRPADLPWIEKIDGKHRGIGSNKVVCVSRSGFTGTALKKAQSLGMETLTIEEATDADWVAIVSNVPTLVRDTFIANEILKVRVGFKDINWLDISSEELSNSKVISEGVIQEDTLMERVGKIAVGDDLMRQTFDNIRTAPEHVTSILVEYYIDFDDDLEGLIIENHSYTIEKIIFTTEWERIRTPIPLEYGKYGEQVFAHGTQELFGNKMTVVLTASDDGPQFSYHLEQNPESDVKIQGVDAVWTKAK